LCPRRALTTRRRSQNQPEAVVKNEHTCDFFLQPVLYCSFCRNVEFVGCHTHRNLFSLCACPARPLRPPVVLVLTAAGRSALG
jgi:hypothetical protein